MAAQPAGLLLGQVTSRAAHFSDRSLLGQLNSRAAHFLGMKGGGKGRPPRSDVIQRVSVKAATEPLPPCRPSPLALEPPNGIHGSSLTELQLMCAMPVSRRRASSRPRSSLRV